LKRQRKKKDRTEETVVEYRYFGNGCIQPASQRRISLELHTSLSKFEDAVPRSSA